MNSVATVASKIENKYKWIMILNTCSIVYIDYIDIFHRKMVHIQLKRINI